jgi:murein DD-endopeptidase MepM/ murein hydrolase activator NlpD
LSLFNYNRIAGVCSLILATGISIYEYSSSSTSSFLTTIAQNTPKPLPENLKDLAHQFDSGREVFLYNEEREDNLQVAEGDTLNGLLIRIGMTKKQSAEAAKTLTQVNGAHDLKSGQDINVRYKKTLSPEKVTLLSLSYKTSPDSEITLHSTEDGVFSARKQHIVLQKKQKRIEGKVGSSFYSSALKKGVPAQIVRDAISALAYDINWQHDPKRGDDFIFVYEIYKDANGKDVKTGDLQYVAFAPGGNMRRIYRFQTAKGNPGYFNEKGESVVKALLQTPMDISKLRITSKFGRRKHPILGYSKAHNGVDFGAATGTPVRAAGDGVIVKANRWGHYGNYIMIRHNNTISTAYAHLSRMKVKIGQRVRQNEVIGNVGATGRTTGAHLHYEVIKNGVHVNPQTIKQLPSARLDAMELARFRQAKLRIEKENEVLATATSHMASLDSIRPS